MRFRNESKNDGCAHNKSAQTYRESAKSNYSSEKKEIEHELHTNETDILKAINNQFEHSNTERTSNHYVIEFFNRNTKNKKNFNFAYEENYEKLKHLWETETH